MKLLARECETLWKTISTFLCELNSESSFNFNIPESDINVKIVGIYFGEIVESIKHLHNKRYLYVKYSAILRFWSGGCFAISYSIEAINQ